MESNLNVQIIPATRRIPALKKVGIYARVSTAGRAQLKSLAAQISGLTRHLSKRDDCILIDIYMDVGSAKAGAERREFNRLLNDCKSHEVNYVMTKSMSRFGRDSVEVTEAVRMLHEIGVTLYFMEENIKVDENYDEFEISCRTAINQSENEHRSENIRMGLMSSAENGSSKLYKKPCFGYKKNDNGDLVPDPYQAAVVELIYRLYLSGSSIIDIINSLAKENIHSPQGSRNWSKKTVAHILTNEKYTGNVQVMKSSPNNTSYCAVNNHEAIIPMEKYVQVQKEMERRTKKKPRFPSSASNLIQGLYRTETNT